MGCPSIAVRPSFMPLSLQERVKPRRPGTSIPGGIRKRRTSMDRISNDSRSRVMAAVRSRRTRPEREVEILLRTAGIRHLRRNFRALPGCPDFVIRSARLVVFVDSCFWHGCRWHCRRPATHREYWDRKIARNADRDRFVNSLLKGMGWSVIRIWEHQLRGALGRAKVISRVTSAVQSVT